MVTGMATTSQISCGSLSLDNGRPGSPACLAFLSCLYWQRQHRAPRKTTLGRHFMETHNGHKVWPPAAGEGGKNTVQMKVRGKYGLPAATEEFYSISMLVDKHANASGKAYRREEAELPLWPWWKIPWLSPYCEILLPDLWLCFSKGVNTLVLNFTWAAERFLALQFQCVRTTLKPWTNFTGPVTHFRVSKSGHDPRRPLSSSSDLLLEAIQYSNCTLQNWSANFILDFLFEIQF